MEKKKDIGSDKAHRFKVHTFQMPSSCGICSGFMWDFITSGVKCKDCGIKIHKQCAKLLNGNCEPRSRSIRPVYGCNLVKEVKACGKQCPTVLEICIQEIEARGLHCEGLYRISGSSDQIQVMKMTFVTGAISVEQAVQSCKDTHVITGAMKLYIRDLPSPLIPDGTYNYFTLASRLANSGDKLKGLWSALRLLPPSHFESLHCLVAHLKRVTDHKEVNRMNAENLGMIFGPTLMQTPSINPVDVLNDITLQGLVVQLLIQHEDVLF
ncbi:N-chimaerin-like isoform X2 [Protopterus annectens]|nr:N-chimaerin-like isoform X2 [Protopterus annectens]